MSQALRRSTYAQIRAEDIGKLISEIGQMTNTTNNRWELDIYQSAIDCFYAGQLHLERAAKIARATAEEEEAQRDKDFERMKAALELVGESPERMRRNDAS